MPTILFPHLMYFMLDVKMLIESNDNFNTCRLFQMFFMQICGMTVLMLAFVRGTALSFGEFLREMEAEFCIGNCKKKLGWVESISVGRFLPSTIHISR